MRMRICIAGRTCTKVRFLKLRHNHSEAKVLFFVLFFFCFFVVVFFCFFKWVIKIQLSKQKNNTFAFLNKVDLNEPVQPHVC